MIIIRPAEISDAPSISRVHIDSWKSTYRGMIPDEILDNLNYARNAGRWSERCSDSEPDRTIFVAVDDGQVIGFAYCGPNRDTAWPFACELYAIYILKEYQGQGIGRGLFNKTVEWLLAHKMPSMIVWVLKANPAEEFYKKLGGYRVGLRMVHIGLPLDAISYGWDDLRKIIL